MKYQPMLQPRDLESFKRLVYCYRITTAGIEAEFHGISVHTARKRLNRLTEGGFLNRLTAWVSDIPPVNAPLHEWSPGEPTPDFGAIAYAAQKRWHNRPLKQTTIYTASRKLISLFALPPRAHLKLHQATHDLALVAVHQYCSHRWPHLDFVGEDVFTGTRGHGEGVEDAQLIQGNRIFAAVEYAGSYRKHRVAHFHQHVSDRVLPYLLF